MNLILINKNLLNRMRKSNVDINQNHLKLKLNIQMSTRIIINKKIQKLKRKIIPMLTVLKNQSHNLPIKIIFNLFPTKAYTDKKQT